jgi:hypothetical protein
MINTVSLRGVKRHGNIVKSKAVMHWRRDCRATLAMTYLKNKKGNNQTPCHCEE